MVTVKIIIVIILSIGIGLFAGWLATKIYKIQEKSREKLLKEWENKL